MKFRTISVAVCLITVIFLLLSCGFSSDISKTSETTAETSPPQTTAAPTSAPTEDIPTTEAIQVSKAEELLETMTLREKVAQLFIIAPESLELGLTSEQKKQLDAKGVTQLTPSMLQTLKDYPVGGIVLFGNNISTPDQLIQFVQSMQDGCAIPLFIGADEEGGNVARIANSPAFDVEKYTSMYDIGQTKDPSNAYKGGLTIGSYLIKHGINVDIAPVADVFTNPENKVIGKRSFGDDPDMVAQMVSEEIKGLREAGVMSCAKHFPGHGNTKEDTHKGYASTDKTWNEMKECELIPFYSAIEQDTDMIMVAHITAVNAMSVKLPASLSYEMVEGKLRGEMGYKGVIITDSMSMGAITEDYDAAQAAVTAISAGEDMISMPEDFQKAFDGVIKAVEDGTISEDRINQSVYRILSLKEKRGLLNNYLKRG